jgi:competence ComEA-like helix-hairpin-helix protein
MKGVFTREERAVVLFLTLSLLVGSVIVGIGRVHPSAIPDFGGAARDQSSGVEEEPVGPVNVNAADVEGLDRLPGIGPARAREIVRLREALGGFTSFDQLLEVKGIGPVTLGKLKEGATLGTLLSPAADTASILVDSTRHGPSATPTAPVEQH